MTAAGAADKPAPPPNPVSAANAVNPDVDAPYWLMPSIIDCSTPEILVKRTYFQGSRCTPLFIHAHLPQYAFSAIHIVIDREGGCLLRSQRRSIGSIGAYDSPYDNASYNVSMPTVPPQTWSFSCFIHLKDDQAAKPQVIVYWDGSPLESDEVAGMERHDAEGDVEFTLFGDSHNHRG